MRKKQSPRSFQNKVIKQQKGVVVGVSSNVAKYKLIVFNSGPFGEASNGRQLPGC